MSVVIEQDDSLRTGQFHVDSAVEADVSVQDSGAPVAPVAPAYLEVNGQVVAVMAAGIMVGRGSDCDIRIDDPGVSRRHAEFRVLGEGASADVVVVDLHSTNGTLVQGARVAQSPVHEGTQVTLGSTVITVHRHDPRTGAR